MKNSRQKKIIEIIGMKDIETQEELKDELGKYGFDVTQATVSRDIRALGLKKENLPGRGQRYTVRNENSAISSDSYKSVLRSGILSIEPAENLIVIKTVSGVAMAVAAALDNMEVEGLIGCIAGDDTIFLAVRSHTYTDSVIKAIRRKLV
ncbi:MAG TPA: arginine repressor [Lachnospiraceae bacterium]|nr:arginine repressor [Lachnospiraceae bacterium]